MDPRASLSWVWPEVVVVATIVAVILADIVRWRALACGLTVVGFAAAAALIQNQGEAGAIAFQNAYAVDGFASAFKLMFLGAGLLTALFSGPAIRAWTSGRAEYFALLASCVFGMMIMAGANDLLLMYLSLEFVSITSYIMAGLLRKNRKSAEASLKYIIYGAGASGMMIYGMSFLYGLTGTLDVRALGQRLAELQPNVPPTLTLVTSVLILAGFGYKIAAAPFHMWCPDVYEGAPTPVTAFFSVGPKAAGFAMLARYIDGVFPATAGGPFEWKLVLALIAVLTMAVGNFGALRQQNLKRLLAYSSIAHAGYLLVAFAAFTEASRQAMLFYLVVYVVMNLGAFLVVLFLEERYGIETVDGCRGLGWKNPQIGVLTTVFLFSLTGLPPTAGFVGKLLVFSTVIEHGLTGRDQLGIALVVVALLFSVVSLFYYMRIAAAMWLSKPREGAEEPLPSGGTAVYSALLWLLALLTVGLGVWWGPLQTFSKLAVLK
ncbi:MAG TPA: NADH-quinone oxidoreductase subunit N [Planctomycetota bacterium]